MRRRRAKHELTAYLTELAHGPGRDHFRPNVWPNTPDILPLSLRQRGRAAFMARVALAANYDLYGSAFELPGHEPIRAGAEEYLHSEKYERRQWDLQRADSLAAFIAVLNRARRENPALQSDAGLQFVPIDNDLMIAYLKTSADRSNIVLCVVNLDTKHTQSGWVELDLAALGLQPQQSYQMHDLITESRFLWNGPRNFVLLDPQRCPAHVVRLRAQHHRENDFDYFL